MTFFHTMVICHNGGVFMKIDKKMIDMVLMMNDDQLWKTIQLVASKSGFDAIKGMEKPNNMSKIRSTLSGLNDDDIARVSELIKKGKQNG